MATKSAHWQAAFRRRMHEAGLKSVTIWMPKEGAERLTRYPEKERGEVITRALALLESQGEFTGNDATLTDKLTGESRDEGEAEEDTLTIAGLSTRLARVEAILSAITSNSTGKLTSEATTITGYSTSELTGNEPSGPQATLTGESTGKLTCEATSITDESTNKLTGNAQTVDPGLIQKAKTLHAEGVSWKEIARRWNAEGIPTLSGQGQWHGANVARLVSTE